MPTPSNSSPIITYPWIAFDIEWEPGSDVATRRKNNAGSSTHHYIQQLTSGTSEPSEEQDYNRITTFAYEDYHGNKKAIDISDFASYHNPRREFLLTIRDKLLLYNYCFGWGSKAIKHEKESTGKLEGINGDLVTLDTNFRYNNVVSIIRYDTFTSYTIYQIN